MCGRYANSRTVADLAEAFAAEPGADAEVLAPAYNVAPTDLVPAVLERRPRLDGGGRGDVVRRLQALRWGLVPSWADDVRIGSRLINARVETVAEKPAFRHAFARRRCLLPADGYYEWTTPEGGGRKQPWFLAPRGGGGLALAGIYEIWRDPAAGPDPDAPPRLLRTAAVITTTAEDDVGHVHDRMPMALPPEHWDAWLDPDRTEVEELRGLLQPAGAGRLVATPVSPAVNDVRSEGPQLLQPLDVPEPEQRPLF
jgi:putative SOS response-associated peptidase YedK